LERAGPKIRNPLGQFHPPHDTRDQPAEIRKPDRLRSGAFRILNMFQEPV
jgi:hypothetical protein